MKSSESLTAVRGMNKKNHIGQMWWIKYVVEISGIEPLTSCVQGRRSPS